MALRLTTLLLNIASCYCYAAYEMFQGFDVSQVAMSTIDSSTTMTTSSAVNLNETIRETSTTHVTPTTLPTTTKPQEPTTASVFAMVTDNTQIGQINESMNSSFSQNISTDAQEIAINTTTGSNLCNQPVTMESISMLFDIKLSPDSSFMTNLRSTLKKDMEKMVSVEVNRAVERVKVDLAVSLDFFSAENQGIRNDMCEKDARIKELESELVKSQTALAKLHNRVTAVEKFSRDLNIEIHEVPENKNENLVALFRQMCECLQVTVTESDIGLCRRVAKLNPDSKRPRNVLVTLSSQRLRDVILSAVTRFNKANPKDMLCATHLGISAASRIYVAEHLSAEVKELHSAARKFCKDNNFKFCWVRFGRVSIRKDEKSPAILIKSIEFLNSLRRE